MENRIGLQLVIVATSLLMMLGTTMPLAQPKQPTANSGDPFGAEHRDARSKNPGDLEFNIHLADGKAKFRPGEVIGLKLNFSGPLPRSYRLGGLRHDRSGRLHEESFHLYPSDGFVDPLREKFKAGAASSMGGLGLEEDLEAEPFALHYDLNEWIRFDKPGVYRLFVTSPRAYRIPPSVDIEPVPLTLVSNIIEFEIVKPDKKWERKQFQQAQRLLASTQEFERRMACRTLRFLGTKSAARELVRQLGQSTQECGFEAHTGLMGSPHRDFVIDPASGSELVKRALQFREETHCYTSVLRSAGSQLRGIEIENLAWEFLEDLEAGAVIDAVVALSEYGSASAEDLLWRRFETWNRKWAGRLPELLAPDNEAMENERSLESTFVHGLGYSPAWLMDAVKLDRLKQLCLTERGRRDVESMKAKWAGDIRIQYDPDEEGWGSAHIAQYQTRSFAAMKEKLSQFPNGAVFRWELFNRGFGEERSDKLFAEVKAFLEGRGMKLVK